MRSQVVEEIAHNGQWRPFGKCSNSIEDLVSNTFGVAEIFWEMSK
jgi:hypothetical protein